MDILISVTVYFMFKEVFMAILTCAAENCTYNKERKCCKGDIMVGGKNAITSESTSCDSFREKKGESCTCSTSHPSATISIDCEAIKCVYNTDYRCKAERVDIKGNGAMKSMDTLCATFKER